MSVGVGQNQNLHVLAEEPGVVRDVSDPSWGASLGEVDGRVGPVVDPGAVAGCVIGHDSPVLRVRRK